LERLLLQLYANAFSSQFAAMGIYFE